PTANLTIHVTSRPALSPEASAWLDKIDAASQQLKTFQADVIYDREQGLMGDKQTRAGRLVYLTGPPAQFAIRFDKRFVGKRMDPLDEAFIFDGRYLVERNGADKRFTRRDIVGPNANPKEV